jgi:hypothetical protein
MERERQNQEHNSGGGGDPAPDPEREARRERLRGLHEAADRTLDSIQARDAEQFLQQHRQRGAQ